VVGELGEGLVENALQDAVDLVGLLHRAAGFVDVEVADNQ